LAREIGRRTHTPVENALRRVRNTAAQAGLTSAKRRLNVSGAFQASKPAAIDGRRVLLIDDVMTTGATAASCARALQRAGARQVTLLTLARADRRVMSDPQLNDPNFSGRSEDA
jgi:predicted amidophosphoribosyltransferase